jgi:hypothetical protein
MAARTKWILSSPIYCRVTSNNMYALINQHIDALLRSSKPQTDIRPYISLLKHLPSVDISTDAQFQQEYRRYWQLNPAQLGKEYLTAHFSHLEQLKSQPEPATVKEIARLLLLMPTHSNGRRSLQFSFASKLAHMQFPDRPGYASMAQHFFLLPSGGENEDPERRLARLLTSYEALRDEYRRVLQHGLLTPAITQFRGDFKIDDSYTDIKIIDTLILAYVKSLKSGPIRKRVVVYG